jgi:hypothetical protein
LDTSQHPETSPLIEMKVTGGTKAEYKQVHLAGRWASLTGPDVRFVRFVYGPGYVTAHILSLCVVTLCDSPLTTTWSPTASRDLDEDDAMLLECATLHNTAGSHESNIEDIAVSDGGSDA